MTDFNILLIGESDFTCHFINRFQGELKLCLVSNSCFNLNISVETIPNLTFLPEGTKAALPYGQICSKDFRIDLLNNKDILCLFFEKELACHKAFFDNLILDSANQLHLLDMLIIDYYSKGFLGFLKDKPFFFLKNYKTFINLSKNIAPPSKSFEDFFNGLVFLFSPGELNSNFYKRYILYRLLNKDAYKINVEHTKNYKNLEIVENQMLKQIQYEKSHWKLKFENREISSDIIISAFPPHIYRLNNVKTPFRIDYQNMFYEFQIQNIKAPAPMAEELVFVSNHCNYYARKKKDSISIFIPAPLEQIPDINQIKPFIDEFIPYFHLKSHEIEIKYTCLPFHEKGRFRRFRRNRSCWFPKSYDYPYFGADGEILYRNLLSELIWKRFLS